MDSLRQVTVSADVNEILIPMSLTIAGTNDTTVEALLVLHDKELPEVTPALELGRRSVPTLQGSSLVIPPRTLTRVKFAMVRH